MNGSLNSKIKFLNWINFLPLMIINSQNLNTINLKKNTNNTMSIVIEFIANTNYEIQVWVIKTCYKLYTQKN
jgi:hypothetical protein